MSNPSKINVPTPSGMKAKLEDFQRQDSVGFRNMFGVKGQGLNALHWPNITTTEGSARISEDPLSHMLKERRLFYTGGVNEHTAEIMKVLLMYLEKEGAGQDIHMYIDSPGGEVYRGYGVIDVMNYIQCDVSTIVCGMAMSMGAATLAAGAPGKRYATRNGRVMIHQPLSGTQGQATDQQISVRETLDLKASLLRDIAMASGVSFAEIVKACERDNYMNPREALEFGDKGLIDGIIVSRDDEGSPIIARRGDAILDEVYPDLSEEMALLESLTNANGMGAMYVQAEADEKARLEARAKREAEAKVKAEAEAKAKAEAEAKAKAEAEAKAKAEAEAKAKAEAEAKAKAEAEAKAKAEAEAEAAEQSDSDNTDSE